MAGDVTFYVFISDVNDVLMSLIAEEQPGREGAYHQAAEGGAETGGGQAGAAEETSTEPDTEGHSAEGKGEAKPHQFTVSLVVCVVFFISGRPSVSWKVSPN